MAWTTLTRRTNDPKLAEIERRLDAKGIPHKRERESMHAPILEVPEERFEEAHSILDEQVEVDGVMTDFDEIPDDHPMFNPPIERILDFLAETPVRDHYEGGICPDCGEPIPEDMLDGDQCDNCEHVFCAARPTDD